MKVTPWASPFYTRPATTLLAVSWERAPDGSTWCVMERLLLDEQAIVEIERIPASISTAWLDSDGRTYPADHITDDDRLRGRAHGFHPITRPLNDDELAAKNAHAAENAALLGVIDDWPTEAYAGVVSLAGSGDRWVYAIGFGTHKQNQPGSYRTAAEARTALEQAIAERQAHIRTIYAKRAGSHAERIRCVFPPTNIEIRGDATFVAPTTMNRAQRRAELQKRRGDT